MNAAVKRVQGIWFLVACKGCGSEAVDLVYESGRMKNCKDCQRWFNLTVNSRKMRRDGTTYPLQFTKPEFLAWSRSQGTRRCTYTAESPSLTFGDFSSSRRLAST